MIQTQCANCGKKIKRYPSKFIERNCCSKACSMIHCRKAGVGKWLVPEERKKFFSRRTLKHFKKSSKDCWIWQGALDLKGYGVAWNPFTKKTVRAHRFFYEQLRGAIPAGFTIDHLCRNHACVNPTHLEPVTVGTNILRGESYSAINARKTQCIHGHKFDTENTMSHPENRRWRSCRTCSKNRCRKWQQNHKEYFRKWQAAHSKGEHLNTRKESGGR